ncbi:MAG TPA: hypothetical protein VJ183_19155 [Chloroflexia bacterium]|nr:hypothetical protein [Chloroflexia bacterium]
MNGSFEWWRASVWRIRALVVMGYGALALAFAWPLPLYLSDSAVLARGADFYQHIWNLWWVKFSLLTLHTNPYHTDYLHFPSGQSLVYHVVDPLNGMLSIPLQAAFGLLTAFNLLRLAHLVFSATAAYALCRTLGLPRPAAWVGGALFAMCPIAATSFDLGQLVEISTGWIPLYILCLIKGLGNRALGLPAGGWGWLVGAGLSLAASALSTWYFFTALVLFTALYVAWEIGSLWLDERRKTKDKARSVDPARRLSSVVCRPSSVFRPSSFVLRLIARAVAIGAGAVVLLSPIIVALLVENAKGGDYLVSPLRTIIANSADLFSLFLPMPARYNNVTINPHGGSPALGWTVIALAVLALATRKRIRGREGGERQLRRGHLYFWLAVTLAFALLAMGPHLLVWGNDTGVPMPYLLLNKVPFLGAARVPIRFMLVVSLAMSVLAAYGLAALAKLVNRQRIRAAVFVVVGLLVAVELVGIPRTLIAPSVHPFFQSIASGDAEGLHEAIMELPAGVRAAPAMLVQTAHQHPILEGYTARKYPYPWFDATPGIAQLSRSESNALLGLEPDIVTPPVADTALAALDYYGVRYVAVYAIGNGGLDDRTSEATDALFGTHNIVPQIRDATLTVYKVPPQSPNGPLVGLGSGWYGVESAGERLWRWTDGHAWVQITNPTEEVMPVRFRLAAYTNTAPRTMLLTLDGQEITRKEINPHPAQQVTADMNLSPGEHWLEISSLQPAETPPEDSRRISLGFESVEVVRR